MPDRATPLERRLTSKVGKTCKSYGLLAPDDRVLLALSGGKDSYGMVTLLSRMQPRLPFRFEFVVVHLDQKQPGYDGRPLRDWLKERDLPHEIIQEDTYSVVTEHLSSADTYCSLCSRLRRGILYTVAERLGCNKIALGHHRDDALETFLLNLFFAGKLQAMPAKYRTNDGRFEVIRPLIECAEEDLRAFAVEESFPILPCNLCGSQDGLKRDAMTRLLEQMEKENPNVRNVMLNALRNVRPSHLLDPSLTHELRPDVADPGPRELHFDAEPAGPSPGLTSVGPSRRLRSDGRSRGERLTIVD